MSRGTFAVPEQARPAWEQLHERILATGETPCADPSIRDHWTGTVDEQKHAARVCLDCPVMVLCGTYAAVAEEAEGTWGGHTAVERRRRWKGAA